MQLGMNTQYIFVKRYLDSSSGVHIPYKTLLSLWEMLFSCKKENKEKIYKVTVVLPIVLYCNNVFLHMAPWKKALFQNIQKRALKVINGIKHSVKFWKVSSIRNKMCALEIFKILNGVSPYAFQNYFTRINHIQCTRANTKSLILPKVKSETEKKAFALQGGNTFNKLTDEMKTETSFLWFKTFFKNFNFDF